MSSFSTYQKINSSYVKTLSDNDFLLTDKFKINLKFNDCLVILFYTQNEESMKLADIFIKAAKSITLAVFASVNLDSETKTSNAFLSIRSDSNHPYNWAGFKGAPFIMVYRSGFPQGFYNGNRDVNSLIEYATTLACKYDYFEKVNLSFGMEQSTDNVSMQRPKIPAKPAKNSAQLTGRNDGFIPTPDVSTQ